MNYSINFIQTKLSYNEKYQITAHPLILIINSEGKVEKRILGYKDNEQLLSELKEFLK